jgi:hypothetical protein
VSVIIILGTNYREKKIIFSVLFSAPNNVKKIISVFYTLLSIWEMPREEKKFNPSNASCENAMTLSVSDTGVPESCEKFPHSSQLNF